MDKLVIEGEHVLNGTVTIGGAKNAALPLLFAAVLTKDPCNFTNVPHLLDITTTCKLLSGMGVTVHPHLKDHKVTVEAKTLSSFEAPYKLVSTMRASILILGPTLARFGEARVSLPGGCSIGARPVDLHLSGLEKMGATIEIKNGYISAKCDRLQGADISFETVSVGATENLLMAATLAKGKTFLRNAALEPEIGDLARFLVKCGVKIKGIDTGTLEIDGVESLHGCDYEIVPDRIEAGTYLAAGAITKGKVTLEKVQPKLLQSVIDLFLECGFKITTTENSISIDATDTVPKAKSVKTEPFPGFPTDMQAQYMALMSAADGKSEIEENIFENRFMHVSELIRLGADIKVRGQTAVVQGKSGKRHLTGASVMATDLRASASLILAALAAHGSTEVHRIYHLDRGYEHMEKKLTKLGAKITRVAE